MNMVDESIERLKALIHDVECCYVIDGKGCEDCSRNKHSFSSSEGSCGRKLREEMINSLKMYLEHLLIDDTVDELVRNKESLHSAAVRFVGRKVTSRHGCNHGCAGCEMSNHRGIDRVCLIRRIAQCSNAEEQIGFLKKWQLKNPQKPHWVRVSSGRYVCSECSEKNYRSFDEQYKFCPNCGIKLEALCVLE